LVSLDRSSMNLREVAGHEAKLPFQILWIVMRNRSI
jgi:hypothetical protein